MSTAKTQSQTPHLQRFSGEWETKRLQDILDINPQNFSSNTNPAYKFNYISLEQVDSGRLLGYAEEVFQTAPSRAQRILQSGDVLMSTVRPNLMAHLFFHDQVPNAVCSTGFAVLRSKHDLSAPYFIFAQLFSQNVNKQIAKILAGSNYPAINSREVKLIEIPCPPQICEQRAIAEVLSDVDGLIGALDALIAKKRAIKQATMQQLLTGETRLPGFSGAWETKHLVDVAICLDNVRIPLNETERANMSGPFPYCGANGVLDNVNDFVLDDDVILIAEDGGYFDEYAHRPIAYRMSGKIWVNNHAHILKAKPNYSQGFLFFSLVHKNILPYLASGTRAKLNKSEMNKIEATLPINKAEQEAIASVLTDIDSEIAALEHRRDKTRSIKQGMMQQLLTGRVRLVKSGMGA